MNDIANEKQLARATDHRWMTLQTDDFTTYTLTSKPRNFKTLDICVKDDDGNVLDDVLVERDANYKRKVDKLAANSKSSDFPLFGGRMAERVSMYYKLDAAGVRLMPRNVYEPDPQRKDPDILLDNFRMFKSSELRYFPKDLTPPKDVSIDVKVMGVDEETKWGSVIDLRCPVVDDVPHFHHEYLKSMANDHPLVAVEKWSATTDDVVVMLVSDFEKKWSIKPARNKPCYRGYPSLLDHDDWLDIIRGRTPENFHLKNFKMEFRESVNMKEYDDLFKLLTRQPWFMSRSLIQVAMKDIDPENILPFLEYLDPSGRVANDKDILEMFGLN